MIKMFGWEQQVEREMDKKRQEELKLLWQRSLLDLSSTILKSGGFYFHDKAALTICSPSFVIPLVHVILTYTVYVSSMCT